MTLGGGIEWTESEQETTRRVM